MCRYRGIVILAIMWSLGLGHRVPQHEYAVELHQGQDPHRFAQQHQLEYVRQVSTLGTLKHFYVFRTPLEQQGKTMRTLHQRLRDDPSVRWMQRQETRTYATRGTAEKTHVNRMQRVDQVPSDPLYGSQWHLHDNGHGGVGVRIKDAWDMGRRGAGVVIGIVDDGLQHTHPDLQARYRANLSHDYNGRDDDPAPSVRQGNFHGTSASGVAAASCNNTHCGCGAAPEAQLAGLRLIAGPVTDAQEATAMTVHANDIWIKSNSWGPMDYGKSMLGPGYITRQALAQAVQHGRNGKGTIFVWAAGNGRQHRDQCGYDGYASSPYTIAVGAIDHRGVQSYYSESCAALLCVAPSSGDGKGITTVDVNVDGTGGYSEGHECNSSFGGTSSACPLVAGVVAILLEERPDLGWRDVQGLIANTSHVVDEGDDDWSTNSEGYHHSHRYGFGRIDAPDLLRRAKTWSLLPRQLGFGSGTITLQRRIPADGTPLCYSHRFSGSPIHFIEHVLVHVDVRHSYRGQVRIRLQSPEQVVSVLADDHDDDTANYPSHGWTFTSVRHWGERQSNGVWKLCVRDMRPHDGHDNGVLISFYIDIFGH